MFPEKKGDDAGLAKTRGEERGGAWRRRNISERRPTVGDKRWHSPQKENEEAMRVKGGGETA